MQVLKRRLAATAGCVTVLLLFLADPVVADPATPPPADQWTDLDTVVRNLQVWVMGILGAVATLFFVVGGARYVLSGGDPGQVEKAKAAMKGAVGGYALALLAGVVIAILRHVVGK
jgi:hypothetical protein